MTENYKVKEDKVTIPKHQILLENEESKEDLFPSDWRSHFRRKIMVEVRTSGNGSLISKPESLHRAPFEIKTSIFRNFELCTNTLHQISPYTTFCHSPSWPLPLPK